MKNDEEELKEIANEFLEFDADERQAAMFIMLDQMSKINFEILKTNKKILKRLEKS